MPVLLALIIVFSTLGAFANEESPAMSGDIGYVEPFKMFDNVYYVGDKWVSSYLIETLSGLVLIDSLDFPYSTWIPESLKKLGLTDRVITHVLVTHGHSDHVGGAEYIQSIYGSKVIMSEKGFELALEQSEKSKGKNRFLPPKVEWFAQDSTSIVIGGAEFKFYITPGHTEGDLSIDFLVTDKGKGYRAFVVGGHAVNIQRPNLAKAFFTSMTRIKALAHESPVVTVNLSNHPHKNNLFENRDKGRQDGSSNPFISDSDFFNFIEQQEYLAIQRIKQSAPLEEPVTSIK